MRDEACNTSFLAFKKMSTAILNHRGAEFQTCLSFLLFILEDLLVSRRDRIVTRWIDLLPMCCRSSTLLLSTKYQSFCKKKAMDLEWMNEWGTWEVASCTRPFLLNYKLLLIRIISTPFFHLVETLPFSPKMEFLQPPHLPTGGSPTVPSPPHREIIQMSMDMPVHAMLWQDWTEWIPGLEQWRGPHLSVSFWAAHMTHLSYSSWLACPVQSL